MLKNTLLPLLASATLLSAEVPSAESLLEGIVRGEDSPAEAGSQIFRDLVVENADADTATAEHVALWVRGLRRAAAEGNREEEGFEILSQSFPAPGGWPTLAAALGEGDHAPAKPVLFQIALAEGNYPETGSWMGKKKEQPKQKGSLLRALLGGPSYESRM